MRRRGAVLRLVVLAELVLPAGGAVPRFFAPPLFVPLPSCFALIVPLERMISHVFPWALTYPQSPEFDRHHPPSPTQKSKRTKICGHRGLKTGRALVSRCYIR